MAIKKGSRYPSVNNPMTNDKMPENIGMRNESFFGITQNSSGEKKKKIPIFLIAAGAAVVGAVIYFAMKSKSTTPQAQVVSDTQTTSTSQQTNVVPTTPDSIITPSNSITTPSDQYWSSWTPTDYTSDVISPSPYLGPTTAWAPDAVECTEGNHKCVGVDQWKCVDGAWKIYSANSPYCGYVATAPTQGASIPTTESTTPAPTQIVASVTPAGCTEGAFNCVGTTQRKCISGIWTDYAYDSLQCGYVAPTPTQTVDPTPTQTVSPTPTQTVAPTPTQTVVAPATHEFTSQEFGFPINPMQTSTQQTYPLPVHPGAMIQNVQMRFWFNQSDIVSVGISMPFGLNKNSIHQVFGSGANFVGGQWSQWYGSSSANVIPSDGGSVTILIDPAERYAIGSPRSTSGMLQIRYMYTV